MKTTLLIYIVLSFYFLTGFFNVSHAQIANTLTDKIYTGCIGNAIKIREDSVLRFVPFASEGPRLQVLFIPKEKMVIPWPYAKETIEALVEEIMRREFPRYEIIGGEPRVMEGIQQRFTSEEGPAISINPIGYRIISCGRHTLDVNGSKYIWDDEILEIPTNSYSYVLAEKINLFENLLSFSPSVFTISLFGLGGVEFMLRKFTIKQK